METTGKNHLITDRVTHFCEDCHSMLYSFCLVAHVHGPADARSLEIVSKYHTQGCAWVARAASSLGVEVSK